MSTGTGKLMCGACGTAIRLHEGLGPCPFWESGQVTPEAYAAGMKRRGRGQRGPDRVKGRR